MQALSGLACSFARTNCPPFDLAAWKENREWKNDCESERPLVRFETAKPWVAQRALGASVLALVCYSSSSVAQVCGA
jgi:hypothetical protein